MMLLSDEARLRPVLELSPGDLGRAEAPDTRRGPRESSGVYWRRCLVQTGLFDAKGVTDDSWLVYAEEMVAALSVRNLLTAHLVPLLAESAVSAEQIPALPGGFALVDGGKAVLTPGCCGDLGDLREWEAAAEHASSTPAPLWTGHPSLWVWREDARLYLREDQEDGYPATPKTVCILQSTLHGAVGSARQELDRFFARVLDILADVRELPDPVAVARALVGRPPAGGPLVTGPM